MEETLNYMVLAAAFVCSFAVSFGLSMFGFIVYYFMRLNNETQFTKFNDETYVKLDQLAYSTIGKGEVHERLVPPDLSRPIVKKLR